MKKRIIPIIVLALVSACEPYLEKTPSSDVNEEQVFGNYRYFQGFLDVLYGTGLIKYVGQCYTASMDFGDDVYNNKTFPVSFNIPMGDYMWLYRNTSHNPFVTVSGDHVGLWDQALENIRTCNHALERMDYLTGTEEEYNLLKGQALFFRAWNHFELAKYWGGLPYISKYFSPEDNLKLPRLSFKETLLNVAADFAAAAELLPEDWNDTQVGSQSRGSNVGRATKGAALALESRALLYAASPLTTKLETGVAEYDPELCEQAAKVAYEVIKMADRGVYALVPWSEYSTNFCDSRSSINSIWTTETIFAKISTAKGQSQILNLGIGRLHNSQRFGGNGVVTAPTVNMVNMYETATGYAIADAPAGDYDKLRPWRNRDPRLLKDILVDGTKWIAKNSSESSYIQLYSAGGSSSTGMGLDRDPQAGGSITGYLIRKYIPYKVNNTDLGSDWNNYRYSCPYIRLAEVYLNYAEALNEVKGPDIAPSWGALTALEAVNIVRRRVKLPESEDATQPAELISYGDESLPDVRSIYTGSKDKFRDRIRNERSVELAFEGHRFVDLRRWYLAHLPEYRTRYAAEFDKNHTYYREVVLFEGQFDDKHYWFPFRKSDVQQYDGFTQNPGW
ncbi:MAG: RagB/SusD family nutrient uptake outer membrane protein [Bacteroidales bacterium]|nr:RagB/SusD family nutrient uptake outer membrane protein [Candidatus Cryptobacteroides aphodequi]